MNFEATLIYLFRDFFDCTVCQAGYSWSFFVNIENSKVNASTDDSEGNKQYDGNVDSNTDGTAAAAETNKKFVWLFIQLIPKSKNSIMLSDLCRQVILIMFAF